MKVRLVSWGTTLGFHAELAAMDARNFVNDAAVPAVIWGPGDIEGSHIANESIAAEDVVAAVEVLVDFCRQWLA